MEVSASLDIDLPPGRALRWAPLSLMASSGSRSGTGPWRDLWLTGRLSLRWFGSIVTLDQRHTVGSVRQITVFIRSTQLSSNQCAISRHLVSNSSSSYFCTLYLTSHLELVRLTSMTIICVHPCRRFLTTFPTMPSTFCVCKSPYFIPLTTCSWWRPWIGSKHVVIHWQVTSVFQLTS